MPHLKKSHGQIVVMSSYSGEIGFHYRTAYCASKFAVTGFFESLRMEMQMAIDITIICPITVETSFREHAIMKPKLTPEDEAHLKDAATRQKSGSSLSVAEAIDIIMEGCDKRARKVIFPTKPWVANYVRPIFPDIIDKRMFEMSKL